MLKSAQRYGAEQEKFLLSVLVKKVIFDDGEMKKVRLRCTLWVLQVGHGWTLSVRLITKLWSCSITNIPLSAPSNYHSHHTNNDLHSIYPSFYPQRENVCCVLRRGSREVESAQRTVPLAASDDFGELKMGVTMYRKNGMKNANAKNQAKNEKNADSFLEKNAKLVLREARKSGIFGVRN